jgi:hypothetical protein
MSTNLEQISATDLFETIGDISEELSEAWDGLELPMRYVGNSVDLDPEYVAQLQDGLASLADVADRTLQFLTFLSAMSPVPVQELVATWAVECFERAELEVIDPIEKVELRNQDSLEVRNSWFGIFEAVRRLRLLLSLLKKQAPSQDAESVES